MSLDDQIDQTDFADPALKKAVVRAWASEKAPTALRARIEQLIQSHADPHAPVRLKLTWNPGEVLKWAVAAGLAIVLLLQIKTMLPGHRSATPMLLTALPTTFYDTLTARHDHCSISTNHHRLTVARTDDAGIAKALQIQLSHAVLVARPPGWNFRGAAICRVGSEPSGHLLFSRGNDTLSIFSVSQNITAGLVDGSHFETTENGHPIVAFTKNNALFCLVSSGENGGLTLTDLAQMRTSMEPLVTAPGCYIGASRDTHELLYAVAH